MRLLPPSSLFLSLMCGYSQEKDVRIQVGVEKRIYLLFEANVHKVDWAETDSVAIKYEENKVIIQSRACRPTLERHTASVNRR